MTSPDHISEWLKRMNYPGKIPSNEALEDVCRGAMGPIFQQIIDRVKPKQEIDRIRKNIIINQISQKDTIVKKKDTTGMLDLYEKKQELEKRLILLKESNLNKEENLKLLKSKLKSKIAKVHILERKIRENEKEETIFRAKATELTKKLESCNKLKEDSQILKTGLATNSDTKNELQFKINEAINLICDHMDKNEISAQVLQEKKYRGSQSSILRPLNASMILSSNKKPASTRKNKATSSRRNIFESVNNLFIGSSIRKRNNDKHNLTFLSSTTLSSIDSYSMVKVLDKSAEGNTSLDNAFTSNTELQKCIENIWQEFSRTTIFEMLKDMKTQDKIKLMNMVDESKSSEEEKIEDDHMETLYACHIQNEFVRKQYEIKQYKNLRILDNKFDNNVEDFVKLQAIEHGLKNSIVRLHQNIKQLKQNTIEDVGIDSILQEIDDLKLEMITMKNKIENQLCLLYDCNSWINKSQRNVQDVSSRSFPVIEGPILEDNLSQNCSEKFCNLPFHYNNHQYLDGWNAVYSNQELLEIIKTPHLSIETIFSNIFSERNLLHKLSKLKHERLLTYRPDFSDILNAKCVDVNENIYISKLQEYNDTCRKVSNTLEIVENGVKLQLNHPFENFVSSERKFNGKTLKEYVEEYDALYKQLNLK